MDRIRIRGGKGLQGEVAIGGAKNAALPLLAATLLTREPCRLENLPDVQDVKTFCHLLEKFGVRIEQAGGCVTAVEAADLTSQQAPYDLVRTMRASVLVLGPLLARSGRAVVSLPGGCAIGARPINLHLEGLGALGVSVSLRQGYVYATANGLRGADIFLDPMTVTGTENLMMAASLARGKTCIHNAAREPEVVQLADVLNSMGARVSGAGTDTIEVEGKRELGPFQERIIPDRIEAATYLVAGAVTGGDVTLRGVCPAHLSAVTERLRAAGVKVSEGEDSLQVQGRRPICPMELRTAPYPGFPTDVQAQMMALMVLAEGTSVITETVFENRFLHAAELRRMGADISIQGNVAVVRGVRKLCGAEVMATDLRASACLVLAGLAAGEETTVNRVYHLDRGYERMEKKLSALGAEIERLQ